MMKLAYAFLVLLLALMAGCATTKPAAEQSSSPPETVLVTYHVKPGHEAEFEQTLAKAWQIYRLEHLVLAQPHIVVRDQEDGQKYRYEEIFTWVSHDAPDHPPATVKAVWGKMTSLCETRDGHTGLEGGEVQIISVAK